MALPMATFSLNPKKHDPFWWYSTEKYKGDDEIWNWHENVEIEGFRKFSWGDFKKSIWKQISQIFPPQKKKKNTNKLIKGFWTKNHPFGDLQLLTKTAGV